MRAKTTHDSRGPGRKGGSSSLEQKKSRGKKGGKKERERSKGERVGNAGET